MAREIRLALGGFDFRLSAADLPLVYDADAAYRSFVSPGPDAPPLLDAVAVRFEVSSRPCFEGRTILQSSATWSILARGAERAVAFRFPSETEPAWVATLRPGGTEVSVACSPRFLETVEGATVLRCSLFSYPLDQILAMYLLGRRGFVLHAAGAIVLGRGVALSGVSGAGKSTFARLAAGRPGWEPLSDDRVIVRVGEAGPTLWGTPWSGEGQVAENRGGPLAALLFLEQGPAAEVRPLPASQALTRLFQTASLPWHDEECLEDALAACGRVVAEAPCSVLAFRPDMSAVEAVEQLLRRGALATPSP